MGEDQGKLLCDFQDEVIKIFGNIKFVSKVKESHQGDIFDLSKSVSPESIFVLSILSIIFVRSMTALIL